MSQPVPLFETLHAHRQELTLPTVAWTARSAPDAPRVAPRHHLLDYPSAKRTCCGLPVPGDEVALSHESNGLCGRCRVIAEAS